MIDTRDGFLISRVEFRDEGLHEQREILLALPKRRQAKREDVEPVVEVFPQLTGLNRFEWSDIGGCGGAKLHRLPGGHTQGREQALLQNTQKFHLGLRRHLADLIEKQSSPIRELKASLTPIGGTGKRPFLVPENLALEQRLRNRRAVDRHEWKGCPRAELVDGLSNELLARSGVAGDEHRGAGRRRLLDVLVNLPHSGAVPDARSKGAMLA